VTGSTMSKRKQALRSLSANEWGAVSALPTEPIRAPAIFLIEFLLRGWLLFVKASCAFQRIK